MLQRSEGENIADQAHSEIESRIVRELIKRELQPVQFDECATGAPIPI